MINTSHWLQTPSQTEFGSTNTSCCNDKLRKNQGSLIRALQEYCKYRNSEGWVLFLYYRIKTRITSVKARRQSNCKYWRKSSLKNHKNGVTGTHVDSAVTYQSLQISSLRLPFKKVHPLSNFYCCLPYESVIYSTDVQGKLTTQMETISG